MEKAQQKRSAKKGVQIRMEHIPKSNRTSSEIKGNGRQEEETEMDKENNGNRS